MKAKRHVAALLAAILLGASATWLAHRLIQREITARTKTDIERTVSAVVAASPLERGVRLTPQMLAVRNIPQSYITSDTVLPAQVDALIDRTLLRPLAAGEQLLAGAVDKNHGNRLSARLAPGLRAVTIGVDELNALAGMLTPGDKIDVLLSYRRGEQDLIAPLLQHVEVLATGRLQRPSQGADDSTADAQAFSSITLQLSPQEARQLALARASGQRLTAVLRSTDDENRQQWRSTSLRELLPPGPAGQHLAPSIAVFVGGAGGLQTSRIRLSDMSEFAHGAAPATGHTAELKTVTDLSTLSPRGAD